jgi:hypothetical protein
MTTALEVNPHEPYLFNGIPEGSPVGRMNLGIWVECECGWIGGNNTTSGEKALASHAFHVHLVTTWPKGEGLEVRRLRAKTWVLIDSATGEQASPKPPLNWPDKKTAERALRILTRGDK